MKVIKLLALPVIVGVMTWSAVAQAGVRFNNTDHGEVQACGDVDVTFNNSYIREFYYAMPTHTYHDITFNRGYIAKTKLSEYNGVCATVHELNGSDVVYINSNTGDVYFNGGYFENVDIRQ